MLAGMFEQQLVFGAAQAAVAAILAIIMVLVARWKSIHIERDVAVSMVRGLVQIMAAGSILILVLQGPNIVGVVVLVLMMLAAGATAARRGKGIPAVGRVSFYGISVGSGAVIALMTVLGAIELDLTSLIPVGSMIIANSMNTSAQALERFRAEIISHTGQIEAGLALGASSDQAAAPYVRDAVKASLIPRIDAIRSLGIVWIPGLMAGMILSGVDPIYAAIYQFVIMAMLLSSSILTSLISTTLVRRHVFTISEQLVLR
jgi:putative ABC transport system permease protein